MQVKLRLILYVWPVTVQVNFRLTSRLGQYLHFVCFQAFLMRLLSVPMSVREMVMCGVVVVDWFLKPPMEQLLFISLFDISVSLKILLMWICFKGHCVKRGFSWNVRCTAIVLFCHILMVVLCFLDVEAFISVSHRLGGLWYAFITALLCMKEVLWLLPKWSQFLETVLVRVSMCGWYVLTRIILSSGSCGLGV